MWQMLLTSVDQKEFLFSAQSAPNGLDILLTEHVQQSHSLAADDFFWSQQRSFSVQRLTGPSTKIIC